MNNFYGQIPYVSKKISRIVLGTAITPMLYGENCDEIFEAALMHGINTFDTARNYANAEISLGKWLLHSGKRDQVVILSKCAHPAQNGTKRLNEKAIREDFRQSTEYLQTDYIDIYLLHRDDHDVPVGEVVEILNSLHAEGKIGAFGGSNWTHERIAQANEYAYKHRLIPFTVTSPNFGLAHQLQDPWGGGCVTISGEENKVARKWYKENNMPIFAYSSLGRGLFSGIVKGNNVEGTKNALDGIALKACDSEENYERLRRCEKLAASKNCTVAQIAMRWIFLQGLDIYAIVSAATIELMNSNITALNLEMTEAEAAYLDLRRADYE